MVIRKYEIQDKKAIQEICVSTSSKASVDPIHKVFTLNMYCDEYLDHETAFVLVEDKPVGYVLCATDYDTYIQNFKPYVETIESLSEAYKIRLENELKTYETYKEEYPAHMHIDILESYTGGGNGSRLIQALIDDLKERHIKGLMLGVSKDNVRAIKFYEKFNFKVLEENEFAFLMGLKLM